MARADRYPDLRLDRVDETKADDPASFCGLVDAKGNPIMDEITLYVYNFYVFKDRYKLRVILKKKNDNEAFKRAINFCDKHGTQIRRQILQIDRLAEIKKLSKRH